MLTAAIYNGQRAKRTDRVWSWTDFYGDSRPPAEPMTDEQMFASMALWARPRGRAN